MEEILRHIDFKKILLKKYDVENNNDVDFSKELIEYKRSLHRKYRDLSRDDIVFVVEIELMDIQPLECYQKSVWEMDDTEKYLYASNLKNEGNNFFKLNDYNKASIKFQEALSIFKVIIHSGSLLNEQFQRLSTHKETFEDEQERKKGKYYNNK